MKLLKSNLNILNNNLGLDNITQSELFSGINNLGLFNDNRRKFITKPVEDNSAQIMEKGDKMRIPEVLDYTGAKYPFKKKKKKLRKHSGGDVITYFDPNTYSMKWYNTDDPVYVGENGEGIYPEFKDSSTIWKNGHEGVTYKNGDIYVTAPRLNINNYVKDSIREMFPNEGDRTTLYRILDPKRPTFKNLTDSALTKGKTRVNKKDSLTNRLNKLAILYNISGKPIVDLYDKTPGFGGIIAPDRQYVSRDNGKTVMKLRGNSAYDINKAITEMSHAFQLDSEIAKKLGFDRKYWELAGGDIKDQFGRSGYQREGHSENDAHEKIENAFSRFVFDPKYKTGKDLIKLIKIYNKKAKAQSDEYMKNKLSDIQSDIHNRVLIDKKGSKIHIKKKNRGKFTDYCGGNVTQDCINRAKHSGNKTLVKRAVFAENARHFKHKYGGQI